MQCGRQRFTRAIGETESYVMESLLLGAGMGLFALVLFALFRVSFPTGSFSSEG